MTVQDARRTTPDSSPALACGIRKKLIAATPIHRDHIVHPSLFVGKVTQRTQLPSKAIACQSTHRALGYERISSDDGVYIECQLSVTVGAGRRSCGMSGLRSI